MINKHLAPLKKGSSQLVPRPVITQCVAAGFLNQQNSEIPYFSGWYYPRCLYKFTQYGNGGVGDFVVQRAQVLIDSKTIYRVAHKKYNTCQKLAIDGSSSNLKHRSVETSFPRYRVVLFCVTFVRYSPLLFYLKNKQ